MTKWVTTPLMQMNARKYKNQLSCVESLFDLIKMPKQIHVLSKPDVSGNPIKSGKNKSAVVSLGKWKDAFVFGAKRIFGEGNLFNVCRFEQGAGHTREIVPLLSLCGVHIGKGCAYVA